MTKIEVAVCALNLKHEMNNFRQFLQPSQNKKDWFKFRLRMISPRKRRETALEKSDNPIKQFKPLTGVSKAPKLVIVPI